MKNQQGQLASSLKIHPVGSREIRWFVECSGTDATSVKIPWVEKGIVWQYRAGQSGPRSGGGDGEEVSKWQYLVLTLIFPER